MKKTEGTRIVNEALGITEARFMELSKKVSHAMVDASNMFEFIKFASKGYDKDAVTIGYAIGRRVADNEATAKDEH